MVSGWPTAAISNLKHSVLLKPGQAPSNFCGRPGYQSPEAVKGCQPSFADDPWAFAVTMAEALTGSRLMVQAARDQPYSASPVCRLCRS